MAWKTTTLLATLVPSVAHAAQLFVSHYSGTVYTLSLTQSGNSFSLTQSSSIKGCGSQPTWVTYDNKTSTLYCSDEVYYGNGDITAFSVGSNGVLTQNAKATDVNGAVANELFGGSTGNGWVAVAHYGPSTITTLKLPLTSSTTVQQTFKYTMSKPGANPSRQDAPHPHHVKTDPTGAFLVAPDLGMDVVHLYTINQSTGMLTECSAIPVPPGTGPRHAVFWQPTPGNTQGTMMYTANELGNSVAAFTVTYNSSSSGSTAGCPTMNLVQALTPYQGNVSAPTGTKVAEVRVHDNFLYSANRNDQHFGTHDDSMTSYNISSNGTLTWTGISASGGWYPRTFSINKAGTLVAIGDQTSANIAIVQRNTSTGLLGTPVASLRVATTGTPENDDGLSAVIWDE